MTELVIVILKINNLKEQLKTLDNSSEKYIELNSNYQKLLSFKEYLISNSELAVNGIETKTSLMPISEALGSFETSLLMYDSDDHKSTNGLRWYGIPTIRAGKHDKNHAGKSNVIQSQVRPSPLDTIAKSMRQIYPMFASGTKLHMERMKIENKGKKSPSSFSNPSAANREIVGKI